MLTLGKYNNVAFFLIVADFGLAKQQQENSRLNICCGNDSVFLVRTITLWFSKIDFENGSQKQILKNRFSRFYPS